MAQLATPSYYYSFSKNYDYRAYLEEKSHFDALAISVDSSIAAQTLSLKSAQDRGIKILNEIGFALEESTKIISGELVQINVRLDHLTENVEQLKSICETGFRSVVFELQGLHDSLRVLTEILRTPDQTWALEQFRIAENAFQRGLPAEALDYVGRAISGDGRNSGFRLEHRFHMLRGIIRLGDFASVDALVVDPAMATADFLSGAKYSLGVDIQAHARCFGLAGWAAYCSGDMKNAEVYLRKSVSLNSTDLQSNYDLGKLLFFLNNATEGAQYLREAVNGDFLYSVRAGADLDYLGHKSFVLNVISEVKAKEQTAATIELRKVQKLRLEIKSACLRSAGLTDLPNWTDPINFSREENILGLKDLSLADVFDVKEKTVGLVDRLEAEVERMRGVLKGLVFHSPDKNSGLGGKILGGAVPIAVALGVFFGLYKFYIFAVEEFESSGALVIFALPFTAIGGAVYGLLFGGASLAFLFLVGTIVATVESQSKKNSQRLAESERDQLLQKFG